MRSHTLPMIAMVFIALFSAITLVSAAPICSEGVLCMELLNAPTMVQAGTDVTVEFSVTYEGSAPEVNLDFSDSSTNLGDFTFLPSDSTALLQDDTIELNAVVSIPNDATGTVEIVLDVLSSTGSRADLSVPDITIEGESALKLEIVKEVSKVDEGVIRVTNEGNTVLRNIELSIPDSSKFEVTFSNNNLNLNPGVSETVGVTALNFGGLGFGLNRAVVTALDIDTGAQATATLSITESFCRAGPVGGNLVITDIDIDNQGEGDDDEWKLLDTIEIEVEVENTGLDDIDDVIVELGLFDSSGKNQVDDLEFENDDEEEIDVGDLDDDDDDTVKFIFKVPADFDDGNYRFAVKAYGDDLGESNECTDESDDFDVDNQFSNIDVEREDDEGKFIAFDDITVSPTEVTCGDRVTLTADVFNIGDEDQDQVRINLLSAELDINDFVDIRNDLDEGDKETVTFDFLVPQNLADQAYSLRLSSEYDYKRGSYRESSDEDTVSLLRVVGCSGVTPGTPGTPGTGGQVAAISASLDSDARAGEELVVRSTITNTQNERASFVISSLDHEPWASLESISERIVFLESGESQDITFKYTVEDDVEGRESFTIEVRSGEDIETRDVVVNIESAADGPGTTGFSSFDLGDSALIWVIGAINLILIILIIVIAVRISRR